MQAACKGKVVVVAVVVLCRCVLYAATAKAIGPGIRCAPIEMKGFTAFCSLAAVPIESFVGWKWPSTRSSWLKMGRIRRANHFPTHRAAAHGPVRNHMQASWHCGARALIGGLRTGTPIDLEYFHVEMTLLWR